MSRKNLIKSRINVNSEIKNDLSTCLNLFLKNKQSQQTAPFQTSIFNIDIQKEPVKYKKNLTDWRLVFPLKNSKLPSQRKQDFIDIQNQTKDTIKIRPQTCSLTKTNKSLSNNTFDKRARTPGSSCRKFHSSFSQPNQKTNISPFNPSLTPFIIVQNIYESNVNNLETEKRIQTSRIRQYYEKKADKVQSFRQFERLDTKLNYNDANKIDLQQRKDFIRSQRQFTTRQDRIPIYQRKSRRILDPNEFYRDYNKVKIPQKFVMKEYPLQKKN